VQQDGVGAEGHLEAAATHGAQLWRHWQALAHVWMGMGAFLEKAVHGTAGSSGSFVWDALLLYSGGNHETWCNQV